MSWKKIKSNVQSFQYEGAPEVVHIIKTGFTDYYMAVHEDAYEMRTGHVYFGSKKEIEDRYKITLD